MPTLLDLATQGHPPETVDPCDGLSMLGLMSGDDRGDDRIVISEYSSEGVCAASRMVRDSRYKYVYTRGLPPMLFDLSKDPEEMHDLAGRDDMRAVRNRLEAIAVDGWDPEQVHARILASQKRRKFLADVARRSSAYPNWAYQPFVDESRRFVRGGGNAGPTGVKGKARFPYVEPAAPDSPKPARDRPQ